MTAREIFDRLHAARGEAVYDFTEGGGVKDPFCRVRPASLVEVATFCRDDVDLRFDSLMCLTGVDHKETLTTVYHLYSYPKRHAFALKVDVPRTDAVCPSVARVWSAADWQERESWDLLGIQYAGHPDLRRLMMPDDWDGHPLRKDYKEKDAYRGMPTTRYSPLQLLPIYDAAAVEKLKEGAKGEGGE
jgi:NADH-quinone oxidoreductase subunit C